MRFAQYSSDAEPHNISVTEQRVNKVRIGYGDEDPQKAAWIEELALRRALNEISEGIKAQEMEGRKASN